MAQLASAPRLGRGGRRFESFHPDHEIISARLKHMQNNPKKNILAEIAGWYGAIVIVLAYVLVSFEVIPASGATYQLLNLSGAIGITAIAVVKKVRQSIVLNIFWAVIAVIALARLALGR